LSEAVVIPSFTPRTVNSIANSFDAARVGSAITDNAAFAKSLREYTTPPPRNAWILSHVTGNWTTRCNAVYKVACPHLTAV
jgi:hypothetical protein